jgi:hypothetical protein
LRNSTRFDVAGIVLNRPPASATPILCGPCLVPGLPRCWGVAARPHVALGRYLGSDGETAPENVVFMNTWRRFEAGVDVEGC